MSLAILPLALGLHLMGAAAAAPTFPLYDPVPATAVTFTTSDSALQGLYSHGADQEGGNGRPFLTSPRFDVLEEGAEYCGAWLETQPMGGAMWAVRNVRWALNNQLVFLRAQRGDGRYPHRVDGCAASWHHPAPPECTLAALGPHLQPSWTGAGLQGLFMASPAVDIAWFLRLEEGNQADAYLTELRHSLQKYDAYLWATRNDSTCLALATGNTRNDSAELANCPPAPSAGPANRHKLLWSVGIGDSGEDGSIKYCRDATTDPKTHKRTWTNCTGPFLTMDMAGYSMDLRRALARIAALQGEEAAERRWTAAAAEVADAAKAALWREDKSAMFDRYADNSWVTSLQHNNLRAMWLGLFDQGMADAFVRVNLMNRSRFFTKMPLPSISVSDDHFEDDSGNNWSGAPEGLTLQRAIRALESYGHHAESVLIGLALTEALLRSPGCAANGSRCAFPQQVSPSTGVPEPGDGYVRQAHPRSSAA